MPTYSVRVADRKTGDESTIAIDASDKSAAEGIALNSGWLVSWVSDGAPMPHPDMARRSNKPSRKVDVYLAILTVVLVGLSVTVAAMGRRDIAYESAVRMDRSSRYRFNGDNAIGATANTIESMQADLEGVKRSIRDEFTSLDAELLFLGAMIVLAITISSAKK